MFAIARMRGLELADLADGMTDCSVRTVSIPPMLSLRLFREMRRRPFGASRGPQGPPPVESDRVLRSWLEGNVHTFPSVL